MTETPKFVLCDLLDDVYMTFTNEKSLRSYVRHNYKDLGLFADLVKMNDFIILELDPLKRLDIQIETVVTVSRSV